MKYYYLIATLPDLTLEETKGKIDFGETIETIRRNLEKEDEKLFQFLLFPNDHRNLLNLIFSQYHQLALPPFESPSIFDKEMLEEYAHRPYEFPAHISDFLVTLQERFTSMSMAEMENQLLERFYQHIAELEDEFIRDYFAFERALKSIIVGLNRGLYTFMEGAEAIEIDRISERLAQEGAGATLLARTYPFIEKLGQVITSKDPSQIEKTVDEIKWDYIDGASNDFFGRQQVFGYVLKLLMVKRWTALREQEDGHLERLCQQIRISTVQVN